MTAAFGPLLRSLRQAAQLTIEDLSHASGVSVRAIGDMERGVSRGPQRRTVQALAEALGLDAERQAELADAARAGRPRTADQPSRRPSSFGLPRGLTDFVGRAAELETLCALARTASADGPVPVAVVHGAAGLGKTSCAVRAAELLTEDFPDGQVYVDLRGVDPEPVPAAEALRRVLLAVGLDPRAIADDEQERVGQLRAALAERRFLVVLDNAADEAQVRPLLPGEGAGMAIVTSRRTLGGLDGVARIALAPLSREESAELLRAVAGGARTETTPADAVEAVRVAHLCGHLPLALRIAGTRLASRPGWTMRHLAERLSDEDRRLANLAVGDVGVEAAFALSYLALPDRAKACFRRLALVPAVDLGVPIAAVLTGADPYDAEDELDHLVELGLLQHEGVDRYRFHDLIRLYAGQRLREEETAGERAAAERRMTDWLLETATTAGRVFEADGETPPTARRSLVALSTPKEARAWLEAEQETWLAALRLAATAERDEQVAGLGEALRWYAADNQHWCREWLEVFGLTRAAAARLPDRRRELWHMNRYAWAFTTADTAQGGTRAREAAEQAMAVYRLARSAGTGAVREQADAVCNAAEAWRIHLDPDQALQAFARGRELAEADGYLGTYYWASSGLAATLVDLGRRDEAIEAYRDVLRSIDELGTASAAVLHARLFAQASLAGALCFTQRFEEAVEVAKPALADSVERGSAWWTSLMHWVLGTAYAGYGATDAARDHLTQGIERAEERGTWIPALLGRMREKLASLDVRH
ncbi:ATP-binding protein [Promicromonospora sp. NPDC057488]|uniref:ATP-binding protein n=1 Tax=Promicromonospora sp. NPDC057488 TaxID=3346147 RepID=UPI00366C8278